VEQNLRKEPTSEDAGDDTFGKKEKKSAAKSAFRAITTWDESVGIIITKNLESRPRRHGSGSSSEKRRR
ncbi:MAG: hypothetical protein ACWGMZ_10895, partial [Thermoguttaceae bacterium]